MTDKQEGGELEYPLNTFSEETVKEIMAWHKAKLAEVLQEIENVAMIDSSVPGLGNLVKKRMAEIRARELVEPTHEPSHNE